MVPTALDPTAVTATRDPQPALPLVRVQLRRAKGWKMPPNTVKVDRSTRFGNVFVVGRDGDTEQCVYLYRQRLSGWACLTSKASLSEQDAMTAYLKANLRRLRGKNLACWCRLDKPCHADTLLEIANQPAADGALGNGVTAATSTQPAPDEGNGMPESPSP